MDTGTIILLIVIMVIMKIFAIRYGAKSIAHLIDHWMTTIFSKKRLEKKAFRQGFFELYQKELELRSNGLNNPNAMSLCVSYCTIQKQRYYLA